MRFLVVFATLSASVLSAADDCPKQIAGGGFINTRLSEQLATIAVQSGNLDFASRVVHELAAISEQPNFMLAPFHLSMLLSLVRSGAEGASAEQLDKVLGYGAADQNEILFGNQTIAASLLGEAHRFASWSTGFWFAMDFDATSAFEERLKTQKAFVENVPLGHQEALENINFTAEMATNGAIPALLSATSENELSYATSAVNTPVIWRTGFLRKPGKSDFRRSDGTMVKVSLMERVSPEAFVANSARNYQAVRLPLSGHRGHIDLVVPTTGTVRDLIDSLNHETLNDLNVELLDAATRPALCALKIPPVNFTSNQDMLPVLYGLGLTDVFTAKADGDLAGMASSRANRRFSLSAVQHATRLQWSEEGENPAPVGGDPATAVPFALNQPFVVILRTADGTIIQYGAIGDADFR